MTRRPKRGDIVYLRTGEDKEAKIITGILRRDSTQYELTCGATSTWHSKLEFQYDKPTGKFPKNQRTSMKTKTDLAVEYKQETGLEPIITAYGFRPYLAWLEEKLLGFMNVGKEIGEVTSEPSPVD